MVDCRVWCALALLCAAACSFPAYQVPDSASGGTGGSGSLARCDDQLQNGEETGVDCGGSCKACPQCGNDLQDGDETGIDCGGTCAPCPTCDDELQNGSESDVDCGGTCAERCETEQRCRESADCASLICAVVCQPANCRDDVRNGQETGQDCGGSCMGCDNGSACKRNSDCQSAHCQNDVCVSAGCTDTITNGLETDEDCGGGECAPCAAPHKCKQPSDCESRRCTAGTCSAPSCTDATQNQQESAADCGGPNCPPCGTGKSCGVMSDCESGLCQNGTCVPQNPAGQPLARNQWAMTTSEPTTESGLDEPFDGDANTCWVSGKAQHGGMWIQIDLGKPEIFFKALMLISVSPHDQDFPGDAVNVFVSNDGTFGAPTRTVQGNQWTWVDFESAQVGRYIRFEITKSKDRWWSIGEFTLYN
jgi:hypothetical protein